MSKELKTGIVSVIIIALFIWGYNFLKGQNIFNPGSRYFYVEFDNISGLNEASIVTINGLKVGKISKITINNSQEKRGQLIVRFTIENKFRFGKNSTAKIYSAGLMGGQNLSIIPDYSGEEAVSGDYLQGKVEKDLLSSLNDKLTPKIAHTMEGVDSLVTGFNQILDMKSRESLNRSILNFEKITLDTKNSLTLLNSVIKNSKENIESSAKNAKKITENFSKISENLANSNLSKTVKKLETTLTNVNVVLTDLKQGKGTLGKLMKDETMYMNLTHASKELEELLREIKLNPKRFVHFSLFGKKTEPYTNNSKGIKTN
ncbi:MlaD family protein [Tenacibaculum sp. C7A-26P2]|uniref:MlaD family protein n=1 Tax=Tenacibaculum sp. C7A-26P2 TaxID=3447504 RepID=UPI003F846E3C